MGQIASPSCQRDGTTAPECSALEWWCAAVMAWSYKFFRTSFKIRTAGMTLTWGWRGGMQKTPRAEMMLSRLYLLLHLVTANLTAVITTPWVAVTVIQARHLIQP